MLGEPCADSSECVGGLCADTSMGRVCTQECDPINPMVGCPPAMYCAAGSGCSGYCVDGEPGAGLIGSDCTSDTDCISAACTDPGDGRMRCLPPCIGNEGMCLAGEVCAALAGSCGSCVDELIVSGLRGLGESCVADTGCAEGLCFADEGLQYCSRDCAADMDCGDGFHCRVDVCVAGPREAEGGGCVTNDDCATGLACARLGAARWCTRACGDGCPTGLMCDAASGVCAPSLAVLGESCETSEQCLSGLCAQTERGSVCTRYCGSDRHCSPGFECIRVNGGLDGVCLSPPRSASGGCAVVGPAPQSKDLPPAWFGLVSLLGLIILGRRRRRG
jgi:hypothetical protein